MEKKKRGFARMEAEVQKVIARMGGIAAHAKGTAHQFSTTEARAAGKKGGRAVAKDEEHMKQIGKKGGSTPKRRRGEEAGLEGRRILPPAKGDPPPAPQ